MGPEVHHRYGHHFTGDDAVDLINAFCIHRGADTVLDPTCGSGGFRVRAYYRKRYLDSKRAHADQLADLFGRNIALYPAHLATLNLTARQTTDDANYPGIIRRDSFDTYIPLNGNGGESSRPLCTLPDASGRMIHIT